MNTIFNKRKRKIEKLEEQLESCQTRKDHLQNDYDQQTRDLQHAYRLLDKKAWKYALFGAKRRMIVGNKGSGKTLFIKEIILPNLKGDFLIIDMLDEYMDIDITNWTKTCSTSSLHHPVYRFKHILDNFDGDSHKMANRWAEMLKDKPDNVTVIIDDPLLLKSAFGSKYDEFMREVLKKDYIMTAPSTRQMKELINKNVDNIDHVFFMDKPFDFDKYPAIVRKLARDKKYSTVHRTEEQLDTYRELGIPISERMKKA